MSALSEYKATGGNPMSSENQRILSQLVEREVLHCISSTVSTLSQLLQNDQGDGHNIDLTWEDDVLPLQQQDDWQEPGEDYIRVMTVDELKEFCENNDIETEGDNLKELRDAAITHVNDDWDWQEFCEQYRIEPYTNEVYEHWAVTNFFKRKLAEYGEITGDLLDFNVWGRCCTGQAICMDGVIAEIAAEMEILTGQKYTWKD